MPLFDSLTQMASATTPSNTRAVTPDRASAQGMATDNSRTRSDRAHTNRTRN